MAKLYKVAKYKISSDKDLLQMNRSAIFAGILSDISANSLNYDAVVICMHACMDAEACCFVNAVYIYLTGSAGSNNRNVFPAATRR